METPPKYEIFISYRRDGGVDYARMIYLELKGRGYNTFFDFNSLRSGKFNENIFKAIDDCRYFILVLSNGALDRCVNEDDWVRHEIEYALSKGKEIIPVCPSGSQRGFPDTMPESFEPLRHVQISRLEMDDLFDKSFDKIVEDRFAEDFREGRSPIATGDVVTVRSFKKIGIGVIVAIIVAACIVTLSSVLRDDGSAKLGKKELKQLKSTSFDEILALAEHPEIRVPPCTVNGQNFIAGAPKYIAVILSLDDMDLLLNLATNASWNVSQWVFENETFIASSCYDSAIAAIIDDERINKESLSNVLRNYLEHGRNQRLFVKIWSNPKINEYDRNRFLDRMTDESLCNCLTNGNVVVSSETAGVIISRIENNQVWHEMLTLYSSISDWKLVSNKDVWGRQGRSFSKDELLDIVQDDKLNWRIRRGAIEEMPETMSAELFSISKDGTVPDYVRRIAISKVPSSMAEDVLSNDSISVDLKMEFIDSTLRKTPETCKDFVLSGKFDKKTTISLLNSIYLSASGACYTIDQWENLDQMEKDNKKTAFICLAEIAAKASPEEVATHAITCLGFGSTATVMGPFEVWPDECKSALMSTIKQTRWEEVRSIIAEDSYNKELIEFMTSDPQVKEIYAKYPNSRHQNGQYKE